MDRAKLSAATLFFVIVSLSAFAQSTGADPRTRSDDTAAQSGPAGADATLEILVPKSTSSIPLLLVERWDSANDVVPGVAVNVDFFTNHQQALALLLRGEIDLLLTGTSMGWQNYLDGGPVVLINTGIWGVSSLLVSDESINGFEDLEGRTISVPFPGAPLDVQVRYILRHNGLTPGEDVSIVFLPFAQSIGALISGRIDAAPLPEPIASDLVMNRGLKRVTEMRSAWGEAIDGVPEAPEVSLFAHKDRVDDLEQAIVLLVSVWRTASDWVEANPEETGRDFAESIDRAKDVLAEAVRRTVFHVPAYEQNRRAVKTYFGIMKNSYDTIIGDLQQGFFYLPD